MEAIFSPVKGIILRGAKIFMVLINLEKSYDRGT